MQALEAASTQGNIKAFAEFLGGLVKDNMDGKPWPRVPAAQEGHQDALLRRIGTYEYDPLDPAQPVIAIASTDFDPVTAGTRRVLGLGRGGTPARTWVDWRPRVAAVSDS